MTLESNILESHVNPISYNKKKKKKKEKAGVWIELREKDKRIFAVCLSKKRKSGYKNLSLILKSLISLLVKSLVNSGTLNEEILFSRIIFSKTISKSRNRFV